MRVIVNYGEVSRPVQAGVYAVPDMLKSRERLHIVEAFPFTRRIAADHAAERVTGDLASSQWHERIELLVAGEEILVPARIRFLPDILVPEPRDDISRMVCALHSRSFDGFQRQAAVRAMLPALEDWSAPFILFVMGEWIAEILEDIDKGLTVEGLEVLATERC